MSDEGTRRAVHAIAQKARTPAFFLRVISPQPGDVHLVTVETPELVVGALEGCQLRVVDPLVSRRHFVCDISDGALRLRDRSTNGTFVNEVRVAEAFLQGAERIRIGQTILEVRRGDDTVVTLSERESFGRLLGASVAMRRLFPRLERLALANVPLVIGGETGTGKEVVAEALHEEGPRRDGPFIVFDCTAVAPSLVESELFGHERGAFTGATEARRGVFELAHRGTLLIDEIGDLELPLQAKLLRAVERAEVRRIGGSKTIAVDVRLMAATRRDLDLEVAAGRFRDDLLHRLRVTSIELPPLREREGDVALLARHFARTMGAPPPTDSWLGHLETHRWPGNVRELRNAIARYAALGEQDTLAPSTPATGPSSRSLFGAIAGEDIPYSLARQKVLEAFEEEYVKQMLERCGGNVSRAAARAGIGRRYFQRVKERHGRSKE